MNTSSQTTATPDATRVASQNAPWTRDDLLHEWDFLRRQGYTLKQAAERLRISQAALEQAVRRGNLAGDPRAIRRAA